MLFTSIFDCVCGRRATKPCPPTYTRSSESIASEIITMILNAESADLLQKEVNEVITTNGWTDAIALAILHGLENAIRTGAEMAQVAVDAVAECKAAAVGFATEHPVYATLLALGVLALLTPWIIEVVGFGELGPIEGSFAAAWQRTYAGYVPKRALFGYFQRLGMKWQWNL
ncbi:uncharacterized protein N7529_008266 [Penicillium soppii]|uniref:uncharacterized protein n=1 Tax=Penicillium soppii TaxID=69789 RepID=UPI002546E4E4|nr:uncharacterized protein N7529_008266 [Penicillium soppii]KAJ5860956.1 hypothetical protein N7529_008266 [Penicillium soppii]